MTDLQLDMYKKLNEINPYYKQTKYPYNYWTPEKITDTRNIIRLVWSKDKRFLITPKKAKKMKGGMPSRIYVV